MINGLYTALFLGVGFVIFVFAMLMAYFSWLLSFPILFDSRYWFFPGDPPFADIGVYPSVICAILFSAFFWITPIFKKRLWPTYNLRLGPSAKTIITLYFLFPMALFFTVILSRNFGDMGIVKKELAGYSEIIGSELSDKTRPLSADQLEGVKSRYFSPPPEIFISSLNKAVKIRIMSGFPPYVGVDFGDGGNAVFDLQTMHCIYSD